MIEPVISVVETIKGFAKSTERFFNGSNSNSYNHNPIEILKRLQREAFSDIMKLNDRQDKVERMISFYKSGKGGPFQEASTHMKGIVDAVGALLFMENDDQQVWDALEKAEMNTGVNLRFIFETVVRQKDLLIAEFVAGKRSPTNASNLSPTPLALEKVTYLANINDTLSLIASPLGARCSEYGIGLSSAQARRIGRVSSLMPPLFNQYHKCGAGVTLKGSNVAVSVAELVSKSGAQSDADDTTSLSTFGQVTYQPFEETSLVFSCLWQIHKALSYPFKLGKLVVPMGRSKQQRNSVVQESSSDTRREAVTGRSSGSLALMLETEFGESNNLGGWIEIQNSRPDLWLWGLTFSDTPEDELGWGLRMAGRAEKLSSHLQLEGFLNFNVGKNVILQPGVLYVMDGKTQTPALVLRSSWYM